MSPVIHKIANKFAVIVVTLSLFTATVTGIVAFNRTKSDLQQAAESKLLALLESRENYLVDYLQSIRQDMRVSSESSLVRSGLIEFTAAWQAIGPGATTILQRLYIHDNPHPLGEKDELDRATEDSEYNTVHGRFHPELRQFISQLGYHDIFLISPNGDLVYTAYKGQDYATNLIMGPWKDTDLGEAFRVARDNPEAGFQVFFDFKPYAPSLDEPASFIASPVLDETGVLIGVIALQMPIGHINDIMQVNIGMGESGETYIVGDDLLMRSDSRFSDTSTILKTRVDTETVHAALAGESGVSLTFNYRGIQVISAFVPLQFMGANWAILAEIDEAEILLPIYQTRQYLLWSSLLISLLALVIGVFFALQISQPIQLITAVLRRLAEDDLEVQIPAFKRSDEIGELAGAAHVFRDNAVKIRELQAEELAVRDRALEQEVEERRQAEESLKVSEGKFRGLLESAPDGMVNINDRGKIELVNKKLEQLTGYHREELIGQAVEILVPERFVNHREHTKSYTSKPISRLMGKELKLFLRHKDGSEFPVEISLSPLETKEGVIISAAIRDITERIKMEEIQKEKEVAEAATQAKSSFLATMSHEIRTPMNGVVGMIDVLQQTKMDSDQRQMMRTVRDSAFALLGIIDDILDFSKIEAGKLDLEIIPLSIRDVIEGVAQTLLPTSNEKGLRLLVYIDPEIPAWVLGDPVRIRQIIFNLAGNAIKFTESSGSKQGIVTIRTDRVESNSNNIIDLRFSVTDTGIGMSLEGVERLFNPFSQAESSTTRRFGGTGLGLSICKNLADLMEGEIGVASEEGKGSTFTFDVSLQLTDVERTDVEQTDLSGLRVLLAIKQQATLDFTSRYLQHSGIEISIAKEFGEVSDLLKVAQQAGNAFDILVLGPSWGEKLRWQLIDALRSSMKELRYLILTEDQSAKQGLVFPDTMVVQNSPLLRSAFILGVGVVVGRASPDLAENAPELRLKASKVLSVEEAEALGQLVLVADDILTNRDVIQRQLNQLGYTAEIASNGKEAFELWQSKNYGLLLSDVHMPVMDGYELTAAIRNMEKDGDKRSPIIAITANALQGEAEKCLQAGMDDYLAKPVEMDKLKRMLSRWLPKAKNDDLHSTGKTSKASLAKKPEVDETVSAPAIDSSVLTSIFGDDVETIRKTLRNFVDAASDIVKEIEDAYTNRSAEGIEAAAHKLKSPAGTVGAIELADVCVELERAGKESNWENIERQEPKLTEKFGDVLVYVDGL